MKKSICLLITLILLVGIFTGCAEKEAPANNDASAGKISIVTTIFPVYDWGREITSGNENIELTLLLDSGVDLHNYQPTVQDIVTISNCDMFIYVGGESDSWVDATLNKANNKNMIVINLLDVLGDNAKEEELVEGMESEEEPDDAEKEFDEHIWLSLKNAKVLCQAITDKMVEMDKTSENVYIYNSSLYIKQLEELDYEYQSTINAAPIKTLLFGDRFPFRYMADDYGLTYYAAFAGCSAESEASFETIAFLANKVDELNLKTIMHIDGGDGKIANTIKDSTKSQNQNILAINSMQSVTAQDISNGATYISIMMNNLQVLSDALQ